MQKAPVIGVIGQGWVGKQYADHFEDRGFRVVRYGKEPAYAGNAAAISECDFVFIAVPTPTTSKEFDARIVKEVLSFVGEGKTAVLKSTILPGTTRALQKQFPRLTLLCNPEFLREKTARYDVDAPERTIIGIVDEKDRPVAEALSSLMPKAPYESICTAEEAELTKYAGNTFLYLKVVYANLFHDLAEKLGADPEAVMRNVAADSRIGPSHLGSLSPDGKRRRGAGGNCLIKDFAALASFFERTMNDEDGAAVLRALEKRNIRLLRESGKDTDILKGVYGE